MDQVSSLYQQMKVHSDSESHDMTDEYYVAGGEIGSDLPLRRFHNLVKQRLISDISSSMKNKEGIAILDTSVGRGGDIKKYLDADTRISFLLGLDIF